jgi:hypothetical protein
MGKHNVNAAAAAAATTTTTTTRRGGAGGGSTTKTVKAAKAVKAVKVTTHAAGVNAKASEKGAVEAASSVAVSVDKEELEAAVRAMLAALGEDVRRDGIADTPKRVAKVGRCKSNPVVTHSLKAPGFNH